MTIDPHTTRDAINAAFELGGALFAALNVVRIHRDKHVAGVDWRAFAFFTAWGIWNLFYYSALSQPFSAIAAIALVLVNTTWLAMVWKYRQRPLSACTVVPLVVRRSTR